jgi:hypothetical protein
MFANPNWKLEKASETSFTPKKNTYTKKPKQTIKNNNRKTLYKIVKQYIAARTLTNMAN